VLEAATVRIAAREGTLAVIEEVAKLTGRDVMGERGSLGVERQGKSDGEQDTVKLRPVFKDIGVRLGLILEVRAQNYSLSL
jgi:hypothetical protein